MSFAMKFLLQKLKKSHRKIRGKRHSVLPRNFVMTIITTLPQVLPQ
jgi:hypothetical protein